jgi:hypothetical protein
MSKGTEPQQTTAAEHRCAHPQCGLHTACSRNDCPLVMMQEGNGRWQWLPRAVTRGSRGQTVLTPAADHRRTGHEQGRRHSADHPHCARSYIRQNDLKGMEKWAVVTGIVGLNDPLLSTYDFMRDVVGYDLAAFFERNSTVLRTEIDAVLKALLAPETT